ncbi:MAG: signal recognition particle-docking protein FtsY [Chthonomonadaceae bacterium]|nr:signal recognition particle-docking protein FtsY [Chthonomonadaceae bacterium]
MFKRLMERVDKMLGRGVIDDGLYDELEEALLQADTNINTAHAIIEDLRKAIRTEKIVDVSEIKSRLKDEIKYRFEGLSGSGLSFSPEAPSVFLFVGVNGVGKTTTIGKLAHRLNKTGRRCLLAAGDTFRAAAIEQLGFWAAKSGSEFVGAQPDSDPASVLFDAIQAAKGRGCDVVLADTAGRQHNKANLMAELTKVSKVTNRVLGRNPDEVILVLDANTGQNAVRQAEEFTAATGVTGLALTKVDGTARGGALIGIQEKLKLPVKLVGYGEGLGDLKPFDAGEFANNLFN